MNDLKKEMNEIKVPNEKLNRAVKTAIARGDKKVGKKNIYVGAAAALLLTAGLSTAFISPTTASFISDIPIVSSIIDPESNITQEIDSALIKAGYDTGYVSVSYEPNKIIEVGLEGTEEYIKAKEAEIKDIMNEILKNSGQDAYEVKVFRITEEAGVDPLPEEEMTAEQVELEKKIFDTLNGINVVAYGISLEKKQVNMMLEAPAESFDEVSEESEDKIRGILLSNGYEGYEINLKNQDTTDVNWANTIVPEVGEELLGKQGYQVKGISYTLTPQPTIIIKTMVLASDESSKELAVQIEKNVRLMLSSEKLQPLVKGQKFEIHIFDKEQNRIN